MWHSDDICLPFPVFPGHVLPTSSESLCCWSQHYMGHMLVPFVQMTSLTLGTRITLQQDPAQQTCESTNPE
ncbi:hypothetical protein KDA_75110 [Dictyobacter alpinus]|uniref:Uncharacterized protein n=1 Tax=Dictyobacter alpinus TaxID=2014873 RepID=A0A402BKY8_9CHLR|nr:hypothetical protein [Dictyobacter alpinus]GCE32027.1 hypothetical protein KDA_75110 [Dictyobacter alpinus]